jgi:hypothetical protein
MGASNPSLDGVRLIAPARGETTLYDASLLSETPVFRHIVVRGTGEDALIAALRSDLEAAEAAERPVSLGAARHSMGGQAIPRDGHPRQPSGTAEPPCAGSTETPRRSCPMHPTGRASPRSFSSARKCRRGPGPTWPA